MKHTKKLLKQVFGKKKIGLKYLSQLKNEKTAPSLFIYSNGINNASAQFAEWLSILLETEVINEKRFKKKGNSLTSSTIIVSGINKVTGELVDKVVETKENKKIVIASEKRPKVLDFISDPSLIITQVGHFDFGAVKKEIKKLDKFI